MFIDNQPETELSKMSPYINWRNFVDGIERFGRNMICPILLSFGVSFAVFWEVSCEVIIKVGVTKCANNVALDVESMQKGG